VPLYCSFMQLSKSTFSWQEVASSREAGLVELGMEEGIERIFESV
jgi:hypothetical protein